MPCAEASRGLAASSAKPAAVIVRTAVAWRRWQFNGKPMVHLESDDDPGLRSNCGLQLLRAFLVRLPRVAPRTRPPPTRPTRSPPHRPGSCQIGGTDQETRRKM